MNSSLNNTKDVIFGVSGQHMLFFLKEVLQNDLGILCIMTITFDIVTRLLAGLHLMRDHKENK